MGDLADMEMAPNQQLTAIDDAAFRKAQLKKAAKQILSNNTVNWIHHADEIVSLERLPIVNRMGE